MVSTKLAFSARLSIKTRAFIELILAGLLWGFGFIGTVWALKFLSPSAVLGYRFLIAFSGGMLILWFLKTPFSTLIEEAKLAVVPGFILWLCLLLQTAGLQYTTATNSTFITTLYVILVPLLRSLTRQERLHWQHWACVFLALLGTGFIVQIQKASTLNWGDLLTLICALFAALHIISVGQKALLTKNDFAFNTFQSFWIGCLAWASFPFSDRWQLEPLDLKAWIGLLVLGLGASMIAFFLQVRAQKDLSPSVVSLLFLLESPASCLFAFLLLNERLDSWQWLGAGLILLSCTWIGTRKNPPPPYH